MDKAREKAVKTENARVRQAVHGSAVAEKKTGVTILSSKSMEVPKKTTIISSRGNR